MAALQCEICGGKLIGKPGGVFECDSCGMEYSTEWAKAKVQEIRGTVKIEGPVEVTGTVKVEGGGPGTEALFTRARLAREEKNWQEAKTLYDQIVTVEPKNGEAYFGLLLTELMCTSDDELEEAYLFREKKPAMKRLERFASPELKARLENLEEHRQAKQCQLRTEEEAKRRQKIQLLAEKRKELAPAANMLFAWGLRTVGMRTDGTVMAVGYNGDGRCDVSGWQDIVAVTGKGFHTVGLRADGTVVAVGEKDPTGRCDVSNWRDIVAIAAGLHHTVGLRADGTVVDTNGDCKRVSDWRDIVAVAAEDHHTVGLRADGTLVDAGYSERDVSGWRDIVAITAESNRTVSLRADGTVVVVGESQCDVSGWRDIVAITAGYGLRADGTVETGSDGKTFFYSSGSGFVEYDVSGWRDIVAIAAGGDHTVGLRADGTVVAVGINDDGQCDVSDWRDIVAVAAVLGHTVGLRADGTVVAVGNNKYGQCDVQGWKLFNSLNTLEQERADAKAKAEAKAEAERQQKISALDAEKASIQAELPNIKGLFSGGRRKEMEAKLAQIERDLKGLN